MNKKTIKQCADCRDGEHDNIDDDVSLARVIDPETGKMVKRAYLCGAHWTQYADDGYEMKEA